MNTTVTATEPPKPEGVTMEDRLEDSQRIIAEQHAQLRAQSQTPTGSQSQPNRTPVPVPPAQNKSLIAEYLAIKSREEKSEEQQGAAFKFFVDNKAAIQKEQRALQAESSE